ncbi:hypothetical protein [Arthrobacter sp. IK3]|uniref:hypothetical protein n=1 Tax=Arthrobacter sp. IK3 TaxID=3448169 RepID=UPI003EE1A84E
MTRDSTRTIPDEAWQHVGNSVFRNGRLYPDIWHLDGGNLVYEDCQDPDAVAWHAYFTLENYAEWAGAAVICPRAPRLEETLVRFDSKGAFIANGYSNPHRDAGVPDWYFFWTGNHTMGSLKRWARGAGLIPARDLPLGRGGYGIDTGLRAGLL